MNMAISHTFQHLEAKSEIEQLCKELTNPVLRCHVSQMLNALTDLKKTTDASLISPSLMPKD